MTDVTFYRRSRWAGDAVYQAEFALRLKRGMRPEAAHTFAVSRARWARATRGMTRGQVDEFAAELDRMQQDTWNREEY